MLVCSYNVDLLVQRVGRWSVACVARATAWRHRRAAACAGSGHASCPRHSGGSSTTSHCPWRYIIFYQLIILMLLFWKNIKYNMQHRCNVYWKSRGRAVVSPCRSTVGWRPCRVWRRAAGAEGAQGVARGAWHYCGAARSPRTRWPDLRPRTRPHHQTDRL